MNAAKSITFFREVPVRKTVDVFIAGGGPAGAAAALAAARQGASVYLAEGHTCFGGLGTDGQVPAFMVFGDGVNFCAGGIGREIYDRLWAAGGTGPDNVKDPRWGVCTIRKEVLKRVYDELMIEAGVEFTFQSELVAVETAHGRVTSAICHGKSGLFAVVADVFVDGTGDGDLAVMAGAEALKGDDQGNLMPGTLCSLWAGIDWAAVKTAGLAQRSRLDDAFRDGVFTHHDRHLPGMCRVGLGMGGGNIGHTYGVDGTDERSLTEALLWGRRSMLEYERYYKEYLKGFETMELAATGALMGIRETRRIVGDYLLVGADFKRQAVFEDEIGRYCYPADIHPHSPDPAKYEHFLREHKDEFNYREAGQNYGIPYRVLTPRGLDNVLVAGRCISADRHMQSSIRVMPGCFITGQAAGVAAAMAAHGGATTREINVANLQQRLKAMDAFLPNTRVD